MYTANRTEGAAADAPVIFTFHGTGGTEHQFHGFATGLIPGARVVSPRGDVSEQGHLRFFRRTAEGVYDMADLEMRRDAMADFVAQEKGTARRAVALGYSNGANIAAAVAIDRPDLFDELILLHPLIPWTPAPQPGLAGRRVLVTAGRADPICPPAQTRRFLSWLGDQGAVVTAHWEPGGHAIAPGEQQAITAFLAA